MSAEHRKNFLYVVFFPLAILYLEAVLRIYCTGRLWSGPYSFTILFSISIGLFCAFFSSVGSPRLNRILSIAFLSLITAVFLIQTVYFTVFRNYMALQSSTMAGMVFANFWRDILQGIWKAKIPLLTSGLPLAVWCVLGRRFSPTARFKGVTYGLLLLAASASHTLSLVLVLNSGDGLISVRSIYKENYTPELAVKNFGLLTSTRLDFTYLLLGRPEDLTLNNGNGGEEEPVLPVSGGIIEEPGGPEENGGEETPVILKTGDNVMEIDFDALIAGETDEIIADMHWYFQGLEPTGRNEYTGMFHGKNLIWIVAEAFHTMAVDETLTPTLYRLAHEGFVFENFYTAETGFSTVGGEFETTTSIMPTSSRVYSQVSEHLLPFGMGNLLSAQGYSARSYHNHNFDYYDRNLFHPLLGYDYKGLESGLDVTKQWPESDVEMMELSVPEYIGDDPFVTYYMTVSGHMIYAFSDNAMATKHKDAVIDLPYSEAAKAYLACNIELDQAMAFLLEELEAADLLEDTVIVLSGDHYPYGLEPEQIAELSGGPVDMIFHVYRSTLILWNGGMGEPVYVDKYCSYLDILPTLCNLFGLEYDSRLMMGVDLLSDTEPVIPFANMSWITSVGAYDSLTDTFIPHKGVDVPEGYAIAVMRQVYAEFSYSKKMVELDYYRYVFE